MEKGRIGEIVEDGGLAFKVTAVRKGPKRIGEMAARGKFVLLDVTVRNVGTGPVFFSGVEQELIAGGTAYEADSEATARLGQKARSLLEEIEPGGLVKGIVVYDIPRNARPSGVELRASVLSDGVLVMLGKV
ncbi:DUF4352 domain-containing protein [Actinocorallia aurea]